MRHLSESSNTQRRDRYVAIARSYKGGSDLRLSRNKIDLKDMIFKNDIVVKGKRGECREANEWLMGHFSEIRL